MHVSDQTVRNRLHDAGMRARRPAIRIPLSVNHRRARREWCQEHHAWDEEDWESVLFTDESKFCLDFTDGRRRVWRRKGERYHDATIEEHDRYGGGSVMVWGGISLSGICCRKSALPHQTCWPASSLLPRFLESIPSRLRKSTRTAFTAIHIVYSNATGSPKDLFESDITS